MASDLARTYARQGKSENWIASELGVSRNTVRRWLGRLPGSGATADYPVSLPGPQSDEEVERDAIDEIIKISDTAQFSWMVHWQTGDNETPTEFGVTWGVDGPEDERYSSSNASGQYDTLGNPPEEVK
jgi:transposase